MKYETYIFDLDGTLLDTVEDLKNAVNHTLAKFGFEQVNSETVKMQTGRGLRNLLTGCLNREYAGFEEMFKYFKAYYESHSCERTKPYNGTVEVLKTLVSNGKKVAIVSNKSDTAVKALAAKFFPGIPAFGEKEGIPRKPAPQCVFNAIAELGGNIDTSVYIGDSEIDVQTAENSKTALIACTWGFRSKELLIELGCKQLADKPADILNF